MKSLRQLTGQHVTSTPVRPVTIGTSSPARCLLHQKAAQTAFFGSCFSSRARKVRATHRRAANGILPKDTPCNEIRFQGQFPYSTQAASSEEPRIESLFETTTGTWQYIISDPSSSAAVIIDPVLDYDPVTQAITTQSADKLLSVVDEGDYKIQWILETHAHADHLSASSYLQKILALKQDCHPPIGIGKRIGQIQKLFGGRYGVPENEYRPDVTFNKLFDDDEEFEIGNLKAKAIHLPGHTPDHMGYKIGDNVFCGDSLFHADIGTARCDFPGGSASNLWNSARKLLSMPDHVKIWVGHDYPPNERGEPIACMTVQEHKKQNKHLKDGITEEEFMAMRKERDESLGAPRLLHQSLQINIRAGHLPKPNEAGNRLLHLPLKVKEEEF